MAEIMLQSNGRIYGAPQDLTSDPAETWDVVRDDSAFGGYSGSVEGQPGSCTASPSIVASVDGEIRTGGQSSWSPAPNILVIDVEGFQLKKDFYVKELAFYNPHTMQCWTGLFKPPFDRSSMKKKFVADMDWASRNMHHLKWEDGEYPYSMAGTMIAHFGNSHQLYAKGHEKCLWIQQYSLTPVIDLEQLGCPRAMDLPFGANCTFHNNCSCAIDKAVRLGRYLVNLFTLTPIVKQEM